MPGALGNEVQRVRTVFKYAFDSGLVESPVRFGPNFTKPSRRIIRLARLESGRRMLESHELRAIIDSASCRMQAMVLLGVNCGFGCTDVANLPLQAICLDTQFVDYPRHKTGIERRCPLWPETVAAIEAAVAERSNPRELEDDPMVFLTTHGRRFVRVNDNGTPIDAVSPEFVKLLKRLDIHRPKLGFYALRHTFETIGGESKDQIAVDHIMGHIDNSMAGVYRERISDDRLKAVTDTVHKWLFPEST